MTKGKKLNIKADETQLGKPLEYDEDLYLEIRSFVENHLDLVEEPEYDVLTAKVFESWLQHKLKELGYLFFIGPPRSGKTRALEVLAELCYNPKQAAYMTSAAMIRIIDEEWTTLFLDEIQQYLDKDRATFMAILNAGQRRGQKAYLAVSKGGNWIPAEFDFYGSKFLASTEDTAKALATRCIHIPMVKNARRVFFRIDKERAEQIRAKIDQYASRATTQKFPDVLPTFFEQDFKDYRNIETFINLVTLTPPIYRKRILDYAKQIDDQIAEEEGITLYSEIYAAIEHVYKNASGGKIGISDILEAYNDGRPEPEKMTSQAMGIHVNIMGLRRKTRITGGRVGRYVSEKLMARLKRRYAPPQTTLKE